jgi:hypothetical protein
MPGQRRDALARFGQLFDAWREVTDLLAVRTRAIQLLARHALRPADAAEREGLRVPASAFC